MIRLYANASKYNLGGRIPIFAADIDVFALREIIEYLPVKLRVLVEVDYVRQTLDFAVDSVARLFVGLLLLGFREFLLPRLLHVVHCHLVGAHLLLHLSQFGLGFFVVAAWEAPPFRPSSFFKRSFSSFSSRISLS